MKRRWTRTLCIFFLALCWICLAALPAGAEEAPRRVVHVVYDDSGSMIQSGGQNVDTWCQAKYAMEVFAALLGENDTLDIYDMSDFQGGTGAGPRLELNGADGQAANVAKVHGMVTEAGNTPFDSVRKAYQDLTEETADEKWLVVLTDGAFQGVSDIDAFFAQKAGDIQVMFLGMGAEADTITAHPDQGIYCESAASSKQILEKITGICTRIFNSDRLEVNVAAKTIDFDVPMSELVVFAQGANVSINGITDANGKTYAASSAPVTVQYSQQAATNYTDFLVDENLKGSILTYKDDFPAGSYTLDVSGADTIEVYYKPNVEIAAYLTDASGQEVTQMSDLKAGEYTITFGFVKAGTTEKVNESSLLGEVTYTATVTNNGVTQDTVYTSGDTLYIEEGPLQIDAQARYLDYHTVSTHLDYSIYADKELSVTVAAAPPCTVTRDGLQSEGPVEIRVQVDGRDPTAEEWAAMELPTVQAAFTEKGGNLGEFTVEKTDTPGLYRATPSLPSGALSYELYGDTPFTVQYAGKMGESSWTGTAQGTLPVTDERTLLDRYLPFILRFAGIAAVILLILGYIPPFKKYLPKRLKRRPGIDCMPNMAGVRQVKATGRYVKRLLPTLIPYRAEQGTIKFVPSNVSGVPVMRVKAAGGNGMLVMNTRAYAGKDHITFNGSPVPEGTTKPVRISAGAMLCVNTKEMSYTCVPSNK